jgi:hypothetical protein
MYSLFSIPDIKNELELDSLNGPDIPASSPTPANEYSSTRSKSPAPKGDKANFRIESSPSPPVLPVLRPTAAVVGIPTSNSTLGISNSSFGLTFSSTSQLRNISGGILRHQPSSLSEGVFILRKWCFLQFSVMG